MTRRPYVNVLALNLLQNGFTGTDAEQARVAVECLKNLTSEDLSVLFRFESQTLVQYENRYTNP